MKRFFSLKYGKIWSFLKRRNHDNTIWWALEGLKQYVMHRKMRERSRRSSRDCTRESLRSRLSREPNCWGNSLHHCYEMKKENNRTSTIGDGRTDDLILDSRLLPSKNKTQRQIPTTEVTFMKKREYRWYIINKHIYWGNGRALSLSLSHSSRRTSYLIPY